MARVARVQMERNRYWIYKALENRLGEKENALVLDRRRDKYVLLLPDYMLECSLSATGLPTLVPEDNVRVVIQEADARAKFLSVSLDSISSPDN